MEPSQVFNTLDKAIDEHQLDYDRVVELPKKSWRSICDLLEVEPSVQDSINPKEGKKIACVVVDKYLADVERNRNDQAETERDLRIAQGWNV